MTSSVLPPLSSKVTVVTGPPSPPSSLVQTKRECGITSRYRPKNSSGFETSWPNTRRAGASKVRVTTTSRSDFRSTVERFFIGAASLSLLASIDPLLSFQFLDNLVQRVEARVPELAVPLEPRRLLLQSARAEPAGPHAPELLRGDQP